MLSASCKHSNLPPILSSYGENLLPKEPPTCKVNQDPKAYYDAGMTGSGRFEAAVQCGETTIPKVLYMSA